MVHSMGLVDHNRVAVVLDLDAEEGDESRVLDPWASRAFVVVPAAVDRRVRVQYLVDLRLVVAADPDASVLEGVPSSFGGHDSVESVADAGNAEGADVVALTADVDVNYEVVDSDFVVGKLWALTYIVTQTEIKIFLVIIYDNLH